MEKRIKDWRNVRRRHSFDFDCERFMFRISVFRVAFLTPEQSASTSERCRR